VTRSLLGRTVVIFENDWDAPPQRYLERPAAIVRNDDVSVPFRVGRDHAGAGGFVPLREGPHHARRRLQGARERGGKEAGRPAGATNRRGKHEGKIRNKPTAVTKVKEADKKKRCKGLLPCCSGSVIVLRMPGGGEARPTTPVSGGRQGKG